VSYYTIILLVSVFLILPQGVFAESKSSILNDTGSWYVGEGLKKGNYFSYSLCHVYYKNCTPFKIDFWVEGSEKVGSDDQWKLQVVVYDGGKIHKGTINLGKVAAEPINSTKNLVPYSAAFRSSLSWLSLYAQPPSSAYESRSIYTGPEKFNSKVWSGIDGTRNLDIRGKERILTHEGDFNAYLVVSNIEKGKTSKIWIVDDFPFPVKADTYAHVSSGVPPQEYRFELLDYQKDVKKNPFDNEKDSGEVIRDKNCPEITDQFAFVTKNTNTNTMIINVKYSPQKPKQGCPMDMIIDFKRSANQEEFVSQVHYDILVVEMTPDGAKPIRSIANEENRDALFTTGGQVRTRIDIKESGKTTYAVYVSGIGPETEPDSAKAGFVTFDVDVQPGTSTTPPKDIPPKGDIVIPSWIKNNAKWWSQGTISDSEYVSNIQYLVSQKIIDIPIPSSGMQNNVIPSWIKNTARFWSEGKITDKDYVLGIQHLINNGIIILGDQSMVTYPITLVDVKPYGDEPLDLGISIATHLEPHYMWLARPSFSNISYEEIEYELDLINAKNRNEDDPVKFRSMATAKILGKQGFESFTAEGIYDPIGDRITKLEFQKNSYYIPDAIRKIILTKSVEDKLVQDFLFRGGKHEPLVHYLDGSQVNELKYDLDGDMIRSENKWYSFLTKDRPVFVVEYGWGHGIPEDPTLALFFDGITHEKLSSKWSGMY